MHLCPANWVRIGHAVMYHAQAADVFSAGVRCRHCYSRSLPEYEGNGVGFLDIKISKLPYFHKKTPSTNISTFNMAYQL